MDIYEALKKDHQSVRALLSQLLQSDDDNKERREALVERIRDELIPHARAEEAVLYNSLREIESAKSLAAEGYTEHAAAEALLRTLQGAVKINMGWREVAVRLNNALEHHIREEETEYFDACKNLFIEEEAQMMGEAFEKMKAEIGDGNMIDSTIDMIANLMPQRLAQSLRDFAKRPSAERPIGDSSRQHRH